MCDPAGPAPCSARQSVDLSPMLSAVKFAAMGDLVTLRPVTEDDLSWLESLRSSPVAAGLHAWHGWSDRQRRRRQWAESGLLG
jgi:hypothetical protein